VSSTRTVPLRSWGSRCQPV